MFWDVSCGFGDFLCFGRFCVFWDVLCVLGGFVCLCVLGGFVCFGGFCAFWQVLCVREVWGVLRGLVCFGIVCSAASINSLGVRESVIVATFVVVVDRHHTPVGNSTELRYQCR